MAESKATAPHFYLTREVDMARAVEAARAAQGGVRRGRRRALVQRHGRQGVRARAPRVPARQRRLPRRQVRAVLARQRRRRGRRPGRAGRADGLRRRPQGAARDRRREPRALAERVRDGTITPPELSGGTFTVSNLGMFGITSFSAGDQPAAGRDPRGRRDRRRCRSSATARSSPGTGCRSTLACDHRILYGADGASSWPACATCWRNRCSWRCEEHDAGQRSAAAEGDAKTPDDRCAPREAAADRRARDRGRRAGRGRLGRALPDARALASTGRKRAGTRSGSVPRSPSPRATSTTPAGRSRASP